MYCRVSDWIGSSKPDGLGVSMAARKKRRASCCIKPFRRVGICESLLNPSPRQRDNDGSVRDSVSQLLRDDDCNGRCSFADCTDRARRSCRAGGTISAGLPEESSKQNMGRTAPVLRDSSESQTSKCEGMTGIPGVTVSGWQSRLMAKRRRNR